MLYRIKFLLFYAFILSIPVNLAKHFILPSAYVDGHLIDYLIPSIYFSDVILIILLLVWDLELLLTKPVPKFKKRVLPVFALTLLFLVLLCFSVSGFPALYKLAKYVEMLLLFSFVFLNFDWLKNLESLVSIFSISVIFQSILGFGQWLRRASVFDNYLYFGEIPYTYRTPGVNFDTFLGVNVIPPYGTFPHPNILGGFLAFSLILLVYYSFRHKLKVLNVVAVLAGFGILLLTSSISSLLGLLFGLTLLFALKYWGKRVLLVFAALLFVVNLVIVSDFKLGLFDHLPSVYRRNDLTQASLSMILQNPVFGVGLNGFVPNLAKFGYVSGPIQFLQPVHNIYLLLASEAGVPSLLIFFALLFLALKRNSESKKSLLPSVLLLTLLLLGSLDHYLLSIQQGLLIFWLTLGMCLSTIVVHDQKSANV